jgi:hypothetical protein
MKGFHLFLCAASFANLIYAQAPAQFVSSKVRTAINSKCTTSSSSVSISPVPTIITASVQYPDVTISSTDTFTPSVNVFTTITPTTTITSTVLLPATTVFVPANRRRDINETVFKRDVGSFDSIDSTINSTSLHFDVGHKRALYPAKVLCAVQSMAVTTSFFTSTAASRTVTRTTTATTTTTTSIMPTVTLTNGCPTPFSCGINVYDVQCSSGNCFCTRGSKGQNVCTELIQSCSIQRCSDDSECTSQPNGVCGLNTCCGHGICLYSTNSCPAVKPNQGLINRRGEIEQRSEVIGRRQSRVPTTVWNPDFKASK